MDGKERGTSSSSDGSKKLRVVGGEVVRPGGRGNGGVMDRVTEMFWSFVAILVLLFKTIFMQGPPPARRNQDGNGNAPHQPFRRNINNVRKIDSCAPFQGGG
uniref:Selenoprotein K n=1 Tax=Chromera velia CCMP2878 TaxID=1169474 RepID=A0A0G4FWW2_9ALVE|eukprot:Cvel_19015.t1-p1 / transcript=Cvel_19015.t1 / gene=Cvel_19015 / organism=Chromera_velia_CCMP2878 / gene_product=hypothetical protein / transcript_product=hypothetical protein / location=Cvel_scaffold1609:37307-37856(-) / protein_length=101 / sequence_SO=supercontig / SO=protein_coding / is_pseudo=false